MGHLTPAGYSASSLSSNARISRSSRRTSSSAVFKACREETKQPRRRADRAPDLAETRSPARLYRPRASEPPYPGVHRRGAASGRRGLCIPPDKGTVGSAVAGRRPPADNIGDHPPLDRFYLREFGFPEAEHMRGKIEFFGNFTRAAIGGARFAGTPGGCRRVRLGHLTPRAPWPQAQCASRRQPHRPDPD